MTTKEAKKLKDGDKVWTYKIGSRLDSFDPEVMLPTLCTVFGDVDIVHGLAHLVHPLTKQPFLATVSKLFETEGFAFAAMIDDLHNAIDQYRLDKERLMDTIRDDLDYDDRQIERLDKLFKRVRETIKGTT